MFDIRKVRQAVIAKLTAMKGNLNEEVIHDQYGRAIFDELKAAHQATRTIEQAILACVKVRQPGKFVMVDQAEWEELRKSVEALANTFKAP